MLILDEVFRADAQIQRISAFLLLWTLEKAAAFAAQSQLDSFLTERTFGEAALALVDYALHVRAFVADDPAGHLEFGFIVYLNVEAARVFDVSARLLLFQLPICGAIVDWSRLLSLWLTTERDIVAGLERKSGLLGGHIIGEVLLSLRVEWFALMGEATILWLRVCLSLRLFEMIMECCWVRIGLQRDLFVRLDNEEEQISVVLRQIPLVIGEHGDHCRYQMLKSHVSAVMLHLCFARRDFAEPQKHASELFVV